MNTPNDKSIALLAHDPRWGPKFKSWRLRVGLSQRQAALYLCIKVGTLRQWEYGRRSPWENTSNPHASASHYWRLMERYERNNKF